MSRAAWLATIAGSAVVLYKHYAERLPIEKYYLKYKKCIWTTGCVFVLALLLALAGIYYLKKDSADGRLLTWKVSISLVAKHPFGVGLGNFSGSYGHEQAAYFASGKGSEQEELLAGNPDYAFNEFLQILIESGIVSFLLFIFIVLQAFRSLIKKHAGMAGALVALLVFACFSYPFSILPFLIVLVFLISMARWNAEDTDNTDRRGFLYFTMSPILRGRSPKQSGKLFLHSTVVSVSNVFLSLQTISCLPSLQGMEQKPGLLSFGIV
jgi:O-antigen ligase